MRGTPEYIDPSCPGILLSVSQSLIASVMVYTLGMPIFSKATLSAIALSSSAWSQLKPFSISIAIVGGDSNRLAY